VTVRRYLLTGLAIGVAAAATIIVPTTAEAAAAWPAKVSCGATITADTRLTHDVVGCPGNGIIIGADHITLDLAGHTISGRNARGSEGVADDGHAGLTVKNGAIQRFFLNGVGLRGAPHSRVSNVAIRRIGAGGVEGDASAGVLVQNSPHTAVTGSRITNDVIAFQSDGVDVISSAASLVSRNTLSHNSWNGLFVVSSPRATITWNSLNDNPNQGVEVNADSDHVVVAHNQARHNVNSGVVVGADSDALITENTLTGNVNSGLFMFDLFDSRVSHNRASGNGAGIDLEGGQVTSRNNRIVGNDVSHNVFVGLVLGGNANHNTVAGNVANANQGVPGEGGGIIVSASRDNTLRGNVASNNLDVGIATFEDTPGDATGNVLTRNQANGNGSHGIDVVAGTVDGGGNIAHRNRPLPNCLGIVCR
jgi:parallel beta-helix repeat protein